MNLAYLAVILAVLFFSVQSRRFRGLGAVDSRTVALALLALFFLTCVFCLGKAANLGVCVLATAAFGLAQVSLNPRRVDRYPAGVTRHPIPYLMFTGQAGARDHNDLGYRGKSPAMPKPDEYRVLMIGGSAVYGLGPLDLTLPAQIEKLAGRPVSAYNWGVPSQVSGQELATITHRAMRFAPDLVILYDGANDLHAPFTADPRPGYPFNFMIAERAVGIFQLGDRRTLAAGALIQANLLRALFSTELSDATAQLRPLRKAVRFGSPDWEEKLVAVYLDNLDCACRLAGGLGFRLAVFLQPVVYFTPQADSYKDMGSDFRGYVEREYDRMRAGLVALSQKYADRSCHFVDLSRVCEHGECVFDDFVHPTAETRAPIAKAMVAELTSRGLLAPASP